MPDIMIETTGLTKDFRRRRAVDDLSIQVFEGDIYGFLGPNGAGKSTTIRMLMGMVSPASGSARITGLDVHSQRVDALKHVGALVESPTFYKYLTARKNLEILSRLSGGCDRNRIDKVLDTVDLLDRADDKVGAFSHGMRQRLGIAQALLPNPKLVVLDEPTNGLDPQGMKDVRKLIRRLSEDERITILISSHLLHEVEQICTRVGIINHGKLITEGYVAQLLKGESGLVEFSISDVSKCTDLVSGLGWAKIVSAEGTGKVLIEVSVDRIPELTKALVMAGIEISAIIPQVNTLEDLFLGLTERYGNGNRTEN